MREISLQVAYKSLLSQYKFIEVWSERDIEIVHIVGTAVVKEGLGVTKRVEEVETKSLVSTVTGAVLIFAFADLSRHRPNHPLLEQIEFVELCEVENDVVTSRQPHQHE